MTIIDFQSHAYEANTRIDLGTRAELARSRPRLTRCGGVWTKSAATGAILLILPSRCTSTTPATRLNVAKAHPGG